MPRNLDSGARLGSATFLGTLGAIWSQKCERVFLPSHAGGQVGQPSFSAFLGDAYWVMDD